MTSLPIDIVNYICEFVHDETQLWRPVFSPNTGLVSCWKVNPHCIKYIELSHNFIRFFKTETRLKLCEPMEDILYCDLELVMTYNVETAYLKFALNDDKYVARFVRTRKDQDTYTVDGCLYKNGDKCRFIINDTFIKWGQYQKSYGVSYVYLTYTTVMCRTIRYRRNTNFVIEPP